MNRTYNSLKPEEVEIIKLKFKELQTRKDLYDLFHYVIQLVPFTNPVKEQYRQEITRLYQKGYPRNYRFFFIKKSSGKERQISAPEGSLKLVQSLLNLILSSVFEPHEQSFGFRKKVSIVDNAALHVGQYYVFNIDLKDFFPSIGFKKIKACLTSEPFNLNGTKEPIAYQISKICCIELRSGAQTEAKVQMVLPQGAPTSPILSNIVCKKLDIKLTGLAKRFNVNYSRYADDITFSANHNLFNDESDFRIELQNIVASTGFQINPAKTRLQRQTSRQEVTGLTVNTKVNVKPTFIKAIRMYLYYWEKYGLDKAQELYLHDKKEQLSGYYGFSLPLAITGKLNFLRVVKGNTVVYGKLLARFNKLTQRQKIQFLPIKTLAASPSEFNFKVHRPKEVAQFLKQFQDSKGLKYLTHDYDIPGKEFQLEEVLTFATIDFNLAYQEGKITKPLYARIKQFAFEPAPNWWRWDNGKMVIYTNGWSTRLVRNWASENPGIHPIRFKAFRDSMITPFKESIQVRPPALRYLLEACIQEKFQEDKALWNLELTGLERAEFYTDVDIVLGGIRHLLDGIVTRRSQSNQLRIRYRSEQSDGQVLKIIEIVHVNSLCYKDAHPTALLNGDFIEAKAAFYGLCNWSIKSQFNDGPFCLNMLSDKEGAPEKVLVDPLTIEGFTHIISFY